LKVKFEKVMMIAFMIILFIYPISYASIPGDIDGNGIINMKDCLQLIKEIAANENPINLIQARPLVKGTYSQIKNNEKTTYIFNEDGTCVRFGPDSFGGTLKTEGTWHYDNESLHINTSGVFVYYALRLEIHIDEYYKAAFTNPDGSKLIMAPPGKRMEELPDIIGRYMGDGKVLVTLPEMPSANQTITIDSIIDVESDGSWKSVIRIDNNGEIEDEKFQGISETEKPTIYFFGSHFYPDIFSSETAYFERE
jgi:hypothetical protein